MSTTTFQTVFDVHSLPTTTVTVYADRAEVKRLIKTEIKPGVNEIVVKKLSDAIDKESVRVEGRGNAVIAEVLYQERFIKKGEKGDGKTQEIREQLDKLGVKMQNLRNEESRLDIQRKMLDKLAETVAGGNNSGTKMAEFADINEAKLDGMDKFMNFYGDRAERLDDRLHLTRKDIEKLNEEINVLQQNLSTSRDESSLSREVSILLDTTESGSIELDVSYLVSKAYWKPSYDIRVFTEEGTMKVCYYGMVQQNTGEQWTDVKLSLSTATSSIGGRIPELGTLKVGFQKPEPVPYRCEAWEPMMMVARASKSNVLRTDAAVRRALVEQEPPVMLERQTQVSDSVMCTSFEITRPTTLPSDNASHKVTVAMIDLKPAFEYETVPSKSLFAYLKARVVNSSQFPFLAGPTSIFLDNNFVAKSELKAVSPSEEFFCSLGVDAAVRIEYKPARKYREETGLISKSSLATHEQRISIKNTRSEPIKIRVLEHIPLSGEEKVKVNLLEPSLNNTKYARINRQNNIEWDLSVKDGETKEIVLKYQIEHPRSEQLEYKEEH